ncbi:MAG: hypothetical protein ABIN80_22985 [Dyadobacter sp.]|uniref:hypothetical protein n=1 Tax=Dyadobacter sp. TaxID=1914288 RepID=UPI003267152F
MSKETELTVEQLKEELAGKEKELSEANDALATLKVALEAAEKSVSVFEVSMAEKGTALDFANSQLAESTALVAQLSDALSSLDDQSEVANDQLIITHGGKKYRALGRFRYGSTEYTAEDLKSNKGLIKILIDKNSSVLTPVV